MKKFRSFTPEKIVWLHSENEVSEFLQSLAGQMQEQNAADEISEKQEHVVAEVIFA